MRAEDLMSSPVTTLRADMPAKQAAALLSERGFTGAPVVDDEDRLVGFVTEADLMGDRVCVDSRSRIWREDFAELAAAPGTVGEVMTTPAVTMSRGAGAGDLARAMIDDDVRSIPIVDGPTVVGIVTRRDLLRALACEEPATR